MPPDLIAQAESKTSMRKSYHADREADPVGGDQHSWKTNLLKLGEGRQSVHFLRSVSGSGPGSTGHLQG